MTGGNEVFKPSPEGPAAQGELNLGIPPQESRESLLKEELINKAGQVSLLYAERVIPKLRSKLLSGEGRQAVISNQEGRPDEELIGLDQDGETILKSVIREVALPTVLMSENTPEPTVFGNGSAEKLNTYQDPLDNSSPTKRGLDTIPYSVVGNYDDEGKSASAAIADLIKGIAYINIGKENFLYNIETKEKKPLSKSEKTTLKGKESTVATFLGEKEYSEKFLKYFGDFLHSPDRERKAYLYDGGGAFIYGLLASGAVDAYVMFDEPISEIIPGLPLALAAGCTVVSVNEDGAYQDFKFDPKAMRENHKLYAEGTVPLFIAAATPEIRDELISAYVNTQKEIATEKAKKEEIEKSLEELTKLRKFRDSRHEEFTIFESTLNSEASAKN